MEMRAVDDCFLVCGDPIGWLRERGYGASNGKCRRLEVYEALYLLERGDASASGRDGTPLNKSDLLALGAKGDDRFLTKYIIYRDLRNRGYVVREGYGLGGDLRLYGRGEYGNNDAGYIVVALEEGSRIPASRLTRIHMRAMNMGKGLILAVVESRGDVVYYSMAQFNPRRGSGDETGGIP